MDTNVWLGQVHCVKQNIDRDSGDAGQQRLRKNAYNRVQLGEGSRLNLNKRERTAKLEVLVRFLGILASLSGCDSFELEVILCRRIDPRFYLTDEMKGRGSEMIPSWGTIRAGF